MSSYYILGYYTTNAALDGRFRRIKVSLAASVAGSLDYRQGYFSNKQFSKFTTADKERQLEDALMLGDPVTELTISMELNYFQLNRAEYFVPLTVKIPGRELALARKGGAEHTLIDFVGEVKDDAGTFITNVRDKVDIKLTGETAAELAKRPIEYDTGFTLLPGKYIIKFLARDNETGRIGTYQSAFVVPNLNREDKRIPISSVVLSSQRVDMRDALFTAAKDKGKADSVNPLMEDGQKLIPSVTRVFSRGRDMYVYLQAYERAADTMRPLVAFVTFYKGSGKSAGDGAAAGDGRTESEIESGAAAIQLASRDARSRGISVPGDGARSERAEGRVLAGAGDGDSVGAGVRVCANCPSALFPRDRSRSNRSATCAVRA